MRILSKASEEGNVTREFVIGLLSSILAALILAAFANVGLAWVLVAGLTVMVFIELWMLLKRRTAGVQDPIVLGSKEIGLLGIHIINPITTETAVARANHSFFFWGISGKRTASTPSVREAIIRIAKNGGDVRFLIMAADSEFLAERARLEGEPVEAWRADILASLARLKELAAHERITIKVRVFNEPPIWRMIVLDKALLFVHYFLPEKQGPQSPQLEIATTQTGLTQPLLNAFETSWRRAKDAA